MIRAIGWMPVLAVAFASLLAHVSVRTGWALYGWDVLARGRVVKVSGHCFTLPARWVRAEQDRLDVQPVRRHLIGAGPDSFASILPAALVAAGVPSEAEPAVKINGFGMYDFGERSPGGSVRYVAMNRSANVALIGARDDLLRELASGLVECS